MRKQFETGHSIVISVYSKGSNSEDTLYVFEARNGRKLEMVKVTTRMHISKLLNNGFHGIELHFHGVGPVARKFFMQCAGIR